MKTRLIILLIRLCDSWADAGLYVRHQLWLQLPGSAETLKQLNALRQQLVTPGTFELLFENLKPRRTEEPKVVH